MSLKVFGKFRRLLLEVEVTAESRSEFQTRYTMATGITPPVSTHYQIQDNKWGCECRIYFDAEEWVVQSLERLGYTVENREGGGYHNEYEYRINSQELFWRLIEHGYRIGENAPIPSA